jgi:hypothetical protein
MFINDKHLHKLSGAMLMLFHSGTSEHLYRDPLVEARSDKSSPSSAIKERLSALTCVRRQATAESEGAEDTPCPVPEDHRRCRLRSGGCLHSVSNVP